MATQTIYEYDALTVGRVGFSASEGLHTVSSSTFRWLETQALGIAREGDAAWLRVTQRAGKRAVQVTNYVGVISVPGGLQIEVLPKVGKVASGSDGEARQLLIDMLRCLQGFRHVCTDSANLLATRMPLLEVFIVEFLRSTSRVVKRGLRGDYSLRENDLFALRGKLKLTEHLRRNQFRADRFFTEHDEFTTDRPENRLIRTALRRALALTASEGSQRLARELDFAFADVPESPQLATDFSRVRLDRGMGQYADALAWSRLILAQQAPLTGHGAHRAPSLLFPMEALFEAFVAKHLRAQLPDALRLKTQTSSQHLVRHRDRNWFRLKPDLLVHDGDRNRIVLDTKWKLLDARKASPLEKYGLSQADLYQMYAYGQSYLDGRGDLVLIYPRTADFDQPLPPFDFPKAEGLRLWVLPFCLRSRRLLQPRDNFPFDKMDTLDASGSLPFRPGNAFDSHHSASDR